MSKDQAKEAIIQISNIIDQWTEMNLDANDALELLLPLLRTVTSYFDLEVTAPVGEKKSLYEDLEKDLDLEDGDPPVFEPESQPEQEDLFSKSEKKEEEE